MTPPPTTTGRENGDESTQHIGVDLELVHASDHFFDCAEPEMGHERDSALFRRGTERTNPSHETKFFRRKRRNLSPVQLTTNRLGNHNRLMHTLRAQTESGAYFRDSSRVPRRRPFIYLKPPYAIGSVPSLSGRAIANRWRSLPRVRRHRVSKPECSSERVLPG